jgi:hypothetical protein
MPLTSEESKRVWFVLAVLVALSQTHFVGTRGYRWPVRAGPVHRMPRPVSATRRGAPVAVPLRNIDRPAT